jgi:hypothetical protein
MLCLTLQPAAQDCNNCGERVARYYCDKCKLWDDDPKKAIYHCDDCGICRQGNGLGKDFFHCKKCNICLNITMQNHKCIERNLESDCPICGEYMFTSTTTVIFMVCFSVDLLIIIFFFLYVLIIWLNSPVAIVSINIAIPHISKHHTNVQHVLNR